jgi:hypothetical protein
MGCARSVDDINFTLWRHQTPQIAFPPFRSQWKTTFNSKRLSTWQKCQSISIRKSWSTLPAASCQSSLINYEVPRRRLPESDSQLRCDYIMPLQSLRDASSTHARCITFTNCCSKKPRRSLHAAWLLRDWTTVMPCSRSYTSATVDKLQRAQYVLARVVTQSHRRSEAMPQLQSLRLLSVRLCIAYK